MKKYIRKFIYSAMLLSCIGCEQYLDVNEDPNVATDVPAELLLKGMELADVQVQSGHLMRISQFWTGQMRGVANLYLRINDYLISPEESNDLWAFTYHGILTQNDIIQENSEDALVKGIANIIEANAIGSMTSLFGDIPYSKVGSNDVPFDNQLAVFAALQDLLDEAIVQLGSVPTSRRFTNDIILGGNPVSWIQVANTLKARYYLMTRNYPEAYQSALKGIGSAANSMRYAKAYAQYGSTAENSNLYYILFDGGSRAGDFTTTGSFIQNLMNPGNTTSSRNNAKTDESRRRDYYVIDQGGFATATNRLSYKNATMPMVTYEENLLILAETGYRTVDFNEGLTRLNALRTFLRTATAFAGDPALSKKYDAYVAADFNPGGIENLDNITANKALLREIIEEKYVSTFGTLVPFDDARRIRVTDNDISLPIPINSGTKYPERMLIAQDEIDGNPSAPSPIPDLFTKTPVNQ